jgi:hypothetical protein
VNRSGLRFTSAVRALGCSLNIGTAIRLERSASDQPSQTGVGHVGERHGAARVQHPLGQSLARFISGRVSC